MNLATATMRRFVIFAVTRQHLYRGEKFIMAFPFVVSEVVRPVRTDAPHAITLSLKLQRRAPKNLGAPGRKELARLKFATDQLNDAVSDDVSSDASSSDPRPFARAAISAWSTLFVRLESLTRLSESVPESTQATALIAACFAEGTSFLRSDYETIWLRGQHSLDAVTEGSHGEALDHLVGDFVVRAVRSAHHSLGVATGLIGSVRAPQNDEGAEPVDRRALLDTVTDSIARYAHIITAIDVDDEAAVAEVVHALDPLIKLREKARTARGESDGEDTSGDEPAQPVVTPDTPAANDAASTTRRVA